MRLMAQGKKRAIDGNTRCSVIFQSPFVTNQAINDKTGRTDRYLLSINPFVAKPNITKESGQIFVRIHSLENYHPEIVGMASRVAKTLLDLTYSKIRKTQFKRMGVIYM